MVKLIVAIGWLLSLAALGLVASKRAQEFSDAPITASVGTWGLADPVYKTLNKPLDLSVDEPDQRAELSRVFVTNNPLDPNAWLIRARLTEEDSSKQKKIYLQQAAKLAWNRPVPLKKIYIEQLVGEDMSDAAATAARLLVLRPDSASTLFFDLYALLGSDKFYSSILFPASQDPNQPDQELLLTQFLKSAINAKDDALIEKIWALFNDDPALEDDRFKQYASFLIDQQNWPRLEGVWRSASNQYLEVSSFADPDFDEVSEEGLCWKMTPVDGVSRTDNPYGIQLSFDGNHNLNYRQLSCIVGVKPGSQYELEYNWSGNKISTQSGMFVEVTTKVNGQQISLGRSEARSGSWSLQSDEFKFSTPQDVQIIWVTIRREPTRNLDNKLSGKVYFTGFKLNKIAYYNE